MPPANEYTQEIAESICLRLSTGESLRSICRDPEMPAQSTVFKWLLEQKAFSEQYTRAREAQMEAMAEEILDIADDTGYDTKTITRGDKEIEVQNAEWINRCRLQVDTRKWLMSKMAPKKYGDRVTHAGDADSPINMGLQIISSVPRPKQGE